MHIFLIYINAIRPRVHFVSFFPSVPCYWRCHGYIWNMVSKCYPGFHRRIPLHFTSLTYQFPQWWGPKTIPTPCHSTGIKILVPVSFLSLYLQFQDADLGFPLIVLVSAGVWQGQLIWLWWGPDLSWAAFIFGKLWSWFPDTLGKHSFVLPSFLVGHLTGSWWIFLLLVIIVAVHLF